MYILRMILKFFGYVKKNEKSHYSEITDIYPCKLFISFNYNQREFSTITNFSLYEAKHIITIIINFNRPPNKDERELEGQIFYKDYALVYKQGGFYQWK